jgi:N-acetylmuramoyl-L-alanine amidase
MRWTDAALALALTGLAAALGQSAPQASAPPAPLTPLPAAKRLVVVLDPAHGGSDNGARLGKGIEEKNVTLALAERLQAMLRNEGFAVTMTRTADVDLPALNRAETANHAQPAACLILHATATGSGVHLFTSSISPAPRAAFLSWQAAQAAFVTGSLKLESELAPLAPGNTTRGRAVTDEQYQKTVEGALAVAIASWRTDQMGR